MYNGRCLDTVFTFVAKSIVLVQTIATDCFCLNLGHIPQVQVMWLHEAQTDLYISGYNSYHNVQIFWQVRSTDNYIFIGSKSSG